MAQIRTRTEIDLDDPVLIEGLPGIGLVGKIATDHIVEQFDMEYHAGVDCDGIPDVAVYEEAAREVRPPVRIYADAERDLLALQSDVPVSRTAATGFADCVGDWIRERGATPLYLSGLPADLEPADVPEVYGVGVGAANDALDAHDIERPDERGVVGGPTGALLNRAADTDSDAVGLVAQCDPQFPDPAAARQLVVKGINPFAGLDIDTDDLVDKAEEIRDQKERLAQRMQEAGEETSSQAQPMRMFQ